METAEQLAQAVADILALIEQALADSLLPGRDRFLLLRASDRCRNALDLARAAGVWPPQLES